MKQKEILAAIHQMKEQLANCQCQIAVLEDLLTKESNENPTEETPVVNDVSKELPAPPAEIHVDTEDNTPDEETVVACQILSKLPDFYKGTCRSVVLQKQWHDNSDKIDAKTGKNYDKLHINKYKVVITAEDIEGNSIGTIIVHWNALSKWHAFLISRGINKHKETEDPHTNWMPKSVSLCID
jgi:hypothetical protein